MPRALHDSFLVRDGRVLDLDAHIGRMAEASGAGRDTLVPVYRAALEEAIVSWSFPRITVAGGELSFVVRPITPSDLRETASLWTAPVPDPRRYPHLKGPDFPVQDALRAAAREHGADEAILVGDDGMLREGAYSSVVHWVGGTLIVSASAERLPSITEQAVIRAAGRGVERRLCPPGEVRGADEVWILSSLHGIRVVTEWDGVPVAQSGLADEYRERLAAMEQDGLAWLASPDGRGL